ncbi:MAG TPA: hypothetical protein PKE66_07260, partial [Pyrinomonadaceae bacterium]|nr:hypothetical protein [Pyrinomonadaceae bacterium]
MNSIQTDQKQAADGRRHMESQQYNTTISETTGPLPTNALASSVLQNVFGRGEQFSAHVRLEAPPVMEEQIAPQGSLATPSSSASDMARDILSRLDERKEKAAVELGVAVHEVESLPFDLSTLESEGIFMNIDCRGFGSLVRQLEWKTLGVKLPEDPAVRVSPPRAGLLPDVYRNQLMRGAAQAHSALNKYGFRFTLCETVWGTSDYKWIPWTAFEQFEQAYLKACETLAEAKAEVLEKYDEILAVLQDSFYTLAEDSADRFQATTNEPFERASFVNA